MWGVPVNDSMVHRYVQDYGGRVEEHLEQETERILEPATRQEALAELEDPVDAGADNSLVIMMDGWMIRERGEQWGLKPAEQQVKDRVEWHEMKTGIVFQLCDRGATQSGRRMLVKKFYEAWRGDPYEFGRRLFALALRHGLRRTRRVYVIADGAVWIWNLAQDRFSDAVHVLDFYHAAEHLWVVAEALFPDDPKQARQWWELHKQRLREKGEMQVDRLLEELTLHAETMKGALAKVIKKEYGYFEHNRNRMPYPRLEQHNVPIGSGAIESTCGQFQDRLKRCGQFWTQKGCRNLVALDLADRNNDWNRIWQKCAA